MTIDTDIQAQLEQWIKSLKNPVETPIEPKVKEWLQKNLGDQYSDDIDTIIVGAKGDDTMIGKYQIKFSPYLDGIQVCSSNAFKAMKHYQMIIDDPLAPHRSETK